jgi:biotin carboxylase
MTSDPRCSSRFTTATRRIHRAPPFGPDPLGWLDATCTAYVEGGYDALVPTQEQVTALASQSAAVHDAAIRTAVPPFASLEAVQDKVAAVATLERLGLPQPRSLVAHGAGDLDAWDGYPCFVKVPIGTASGGVQRIENPGELADAVRSPAFAAALAGPELVLQEAADGPLLMLQTVFDQGRLVAHHANERVREGARGGASHKRSAAAPEARAALARLGEALDWHGALSADAIATTDGPLLIDINPRLVEPGNALRSGVDLVAALLAICRSEHPAAIPAGRDGIRTHQLLLAVLGAAQRGGGRRAVAHELVEAARHRGEYRSSTEELTPVAHDLLAAIPVTVAATATLAWPPAWAAIAGSSVTSYALAPDGWDLLRRERS